MTLTLIAYGITKDILGGREVAYDLRQGKTVAALLRQLEQDYPALEGLASLRVAVNSEYASAQTPITPQDEVVLIPPVSGG